MTVATLLAAWLALGPAHQDGYDAPTDTHVVLVAGLWHDDVLSPAHGWNRYTFVAPRSGYVAVQMRAPRDHATLWSYVRVVDGSRSRAAVGNRKTNLCELIVHVVRGRRYEIIATSQANATLRRHERQTTEGRYTIGVVALDVR